MLALFLMRCPVLIFRRGLALFFLSLAIANFPTRITLAQDQPGRADELRAQLEKLQSALRDVEHKEEQRGKVTEIGSSRGRVRDIDDPRLVVKVYDLSDLFTVAPSYLAYEPLELLRTGEPQPVFPQVAAHSEGTGGIGGGGFGGGFFAVPNSPPRPMSIDRTMEATLNQGSGNSGAPAASLRTSMQSLVDTITSTIDPDAWSDVGGHSTIAPVGSSLIISTSSETHAKLTALIDLFRQRWGSLRTISIDARWLWLKTADVDAAVAPAPNQAGPAASVNTLTPDAWKKLQTTAEENGGRSYQAMVTCYNGQTVAAQAGSQRLAVVGLTPVITSGEAASVSYSPVLRTLHDGATLQITPLATRHVKYVVLDVHSRVNLLPPVKAAPERKEDAKPFGAQANDPRQLVEALDRGAVQTQRLETTLRIPVGQPTLIGGMTFVGAEGKNANLYLFITAKVQELRDDDSTAPAAAAVEAPPAEKKQ